jgi:hypothetical protein
LLLAGYAAQSLLAAIGCVQFVSNVLFASFVLKEKVSLQHQRASADPCVDPLTTSTCNRNVLTQPAAVNGPVHALRSGQT